MKAYLGSVDAVQAKIASDISATLGTNEDALALHLAAGLAEYAAYERARCAQPGDTASLILIAAALSRAAGGEDKALTDVEGTARTILKKAAAAK